MPRFRGSLAFPGAVAEGPRPTLCIGVDDHHTPDWLRDLVSERALSTA